MFHFKPLIIFKILQIHFKTKVFRDFLIWLSKQVFSSPKLVLGILFFRPLTKPEGAAGDGLLLPPDDPKHTLLMRAHLTLPAKNFRVATVYVLQQTAGEGRELPFQKRTH